MIRHKRVERHKAHCFTGIYWTGRSWTETRQFCSRYSISRWLLWTYRLEFSFRFHIFKPVGKNVNLIINNGMDLWTYKCLHVFLWSKLSQTTVFWTKNCEIDQNYFILIFIRYLSENVSTSGLYASKLALVQPCSTLDTDIYYLVIFL